MMQVTLPWLQVFDGSIMATLALGGGSDETQEHVGMDLSPCFPPSSGVPRMAEDRIFPSTLALPFDLIPFFFWHHSFDGPSVLWRSFDRILRIEGDRS